MNDLRKVLVVDSGRRGVVDPLSTELAELGVSSVTASVEAAGEVLDLIELPSAVLLNLPDAIAGRQGFYDLADQLKNGLRTRDIPVILWENGRAAGGVSTVLANQFGSQVLSEPEL